jgi:hypothetical protein
VDRETCSGWYAFLIDSKGNLDKSWLLRGQNTENPGDLVWGGGVRDGVQSSPKGFAREILDAYLDHLISVGPEEVEYLLYEDEDDTKLRVRVWDIPVVDRDRISAGWSIPDPATRLSHGYARGLSVEGFEPTSVVTLPAEVVRTRLRRKMAERQEHPDPSPPDQPSADT